VAGVEDGQAGGPQPLREVAAVGGRHQEITSAVRHADRNADLRQQGSQQGQLLRVTAYVAADSQNELRDFLTSWRARITPGQAGLPAYGGNRRVAGLRREEAAMLAGV
jgi:hypothetical protein